MKSNSKQTKYLVEGKSATGKSTIINEICKRFNYHSIDSYSTRRPRYKGEKGHIFLDEKNYDFEYYKDGKRLPHYQKDYDDVIIHNLHTKERIHPIAYTYFNNAHYWATSHQLNQNHFYVVDKKGVDYVLDKVGDKFNFKVIYINIPLHIRILRLFKRDGLIKTISRLWNDHTMFKGVECDYEIYNLDLEESIQELHNIVKKNKEDLNND